MYYFSMKREQLKQILLQYYSVAGVNMILRGDRKPSYETICLITKEHNIPFEAWLDIKSFVNNIKDIGDTTTT